MKNPALLEEIKTYRGRDEVPEDFDAFWDGEVKNVSTLPSYHLEERDFHIPQVKCYELTFEGSKEARKERSMHALFFQRVRRRFH